MDVARCEDVSRKGIQPAAVWAARLGYCMLGLHFSGWAALVPYTKTRLGVNEAELGMLLLCVGLGAVLAMPVAGVLTERLGCRKVLTGGIAGAFVMLCAAAVVPTVGLVGLCLLLFGLQLGTIDVAMNVQAVLIEKALGRSMMSGLHAMYNVGCISGACCMALLFAVGTPPPVAVCCLVACALVVLFSFCARHFLPYGREGGKPAPLFVVPRGLVLLMGAMCFVIYLGEGVVMDWGALFMNNVMQVDPAWGTLSFALFACLCTAGRLVGDSLVQAFGSRRIFAGGGVLAALGFVLVSCSPWAWLCFAGFALAGAGAANMAPVLYSLAGKQQVMPASLALAAVTSVGYLGILAGPAIMGFVAHAWGLTVVFAIAAVLTVLVAAASYKLH